MATSKIFFVVSGLLILGCSTLSLMSREPATDRLPQASRGSYFDENIRPVFQSRCIQCHSCYNAPCQMNLASVEGLDRGLVQDYEVFNPSRLTSIEPSRLGIDRKTTEEWRHFSRSLIPGKGISFQPVTQNTGDEKQNLETSLILNLVEHKKAHAGLAVDDFANPDQAPEASRVCPDTPKKLKAHLITRPNAGMPYGLPPLSTGQIQKLKEWTMMGSPREGVNKEIAEKDLAQIRQIENFLNLYLTLSDLNEAKRQSLVSRYLYEHLFLAHIHLRQERAPDAFYSLIRSSKACTDPEEIATRRPWEKTKPAGFFYCLKRIDAMLVHKTHITYLIDQPKLQRWSSLFYSTPWRVSFEGKNGAVDVAPRDDKRASNPFLVFKDIPAKARYQFLLDDAHYHVMTFIKGPVCKGQTAVNSIDEQFYVLFMKPEADLMVRNQKFLRESIPLLDLPARKGSDQSLGAVRNGTSLLKLRNEYRTLRDKYYGIEFPQGYEVDDLWNGRESESSRGESANPNAALTVFRHMDSAAVVKGLVGATSKTSLVLDYSIFERFYYDLVSGFDVFGDLSHQFQTRLYMAYIRMEAEENFLSFFPSSVRPPMRRSWYIEGASASEKGGDLLGKDKISTLFPLLGLNRGTRVPLPELDENRYAKFGSIEKLSALRDYRRQLIGLFKTRLGAALVNNNQLNPDKSLFAKTSDLRISDIRDLADFDREVAKLSDLPALNSKWVRFMPSSALLLVESAKGPELYTLVRNKEHLNIAWVLDENSRRSEAADTISVFKGVLTSYPNFTFSIDISQAREFLEGMAAVSDGNSYDAFSRKFGNPRSGQGSEKFWATSDRVHQVFQHKYPREYGALDYNRYGVDYRYNDEEREDLFKNLPESLRKEFSSEIK